MKEATKSLFNKNIEKIMALLDHEIYVVYLDKTVKCTCLHEGTSQPDAACKKCLGTGYKIKIRKCMAVCQNTSVPTTIRNTTGFVIARNYYVRASDSLKNDDIIVDGEGVYFLFQGPEFASFDGQYIFQKCSAMPKKLDTEDFLINFNQIVGR